MTLEETKAVLAALVHEEVEFVVIGSMAMAAQGLPRATQDRADAARIREAFELEDE